jgi:RNA polymerase sigma-70 factor (ECF subfamily)
VTKTGTRRQYPDVSESSRLADFDALYAAEFDYVFRTLRRLGVREADVQDAVHDVFVVVHRRLSEIEVERPIRPWLFGVARKVAAARRRRDRPVGDAGELTAPGPRPDDRLASHELLWNALSRLGDDRREVFVLHDIEGYSGAEIAELLGVNVNTIHSRLRQARADLAAIVRRLRGGEP